MPIHDHEATFQGRAFLWGGLVLGVVFVAALLTHGFGLLGPSSKGEAPPDLMVRKGDKIIVPEGSALRSRLTIEAASARPVNATLALPAVVESDPSRTAAVLAPLGGRLVALKVGLGDRVVQGQVLAVIDSPDLGQAYDDDDKAADTLKLADRNLTRQEGQNKIGAASERDLDQARSDRAQAEAEFTRTQARLKTLGAAHDKTRLLAVTAPVGGSVTSLAVAAGNMINDPTQPLMTIADLSTVWVTALVPEKDMPRSPRTSPPTWRSSAYPDKVLHGKVLVRLRCDRAGFPPQQNPHRLRRTATTRSSPICSRRSRVTGPARTAGRAAELGVAHEQRSNQRFRRHRAVDLRAPHGRSRTRRGLIGRRSLRRRARRSSGGQGRNSAQ